MQELDDELSVLTMQLFPAEQEGSLATTDLDK